jgi:hypothetical protein
MESRRQPDYIWIRPVGWLIAVHRGAARRSLRPFYAEEGRSLALNHHWMSQSHAMLQSSQAFASCAIPMGLWTKRMRQSGRSRSAIS